jgi:hypothetical protein
MNYLAAENLPDGGVYLRLSLADCDGYEIRRAETQNGTYSVVKDLKPSYFEGYDSTYLVADAVIGKPTYYKVYSYRYASGTGRKLFAEDSAVAYAIARPPQGRIDSATQESGSVKLKMTNWLCSGYDVYRAAGDSSTFSLVATLTLNGETGEKIVTEGGSENDESVVWTDNSVLEGKYQYYVVPYAINFGVKAPALASDIVRVQVQ